MQATAFDKVVRLQEGGDVSAARALCLELLENAPQDAGALHALGVIEIQAGNVAEAIERLEQASRLCEAATVWNHLGAAYGSANRSEDALAAFERALELDDDLADTHYNLGTALRRIGRHDEAVVRMRRAVELRPSFAEAHFNLGNELREQGLLTEAADSFRRAIQVRPGYAKARKNLVKLLQRMAMDVRAEGDAEGADRLTGEIVAHLEDSNAADLQLGWALAALGDHEAAIDRYRKAVSFQPDRADALVNLGASLHALRRLDEAEDACRQAIATNPDLAEAHYNLGEALLLQGKFAAGWPEYEWRHKLNKTTADEQNGKAGGEASPPAWDGSCLSGKRILLQCEQGIGDSFQFVRYAPILKQQGATVVVRCPTVTRPILSTCAGIDELVCGEPLSAPVDCCISMLSIPLQLKTDLESIPSGSPYLHAAPGLIDYWRMRLAEHQSFKIGIAWRGSPKHKGDAVRSIPLELFASLAEIEGVQLVNLQKNQGLDELAEFKRRYEVIDFGEELDLQPGPFMDTAAIIANLDLVVCCDTAIGHLAGAVGAEVWLALAFSSDWRWMCDRSDSPWYPHHRLFRQPVRGDWKSVFAEMVRALRRRLGRPDVSRSNGKPACDNSSLHQSAIEAFSRCDYRKAEELLLRVVAISPTAEAYNQLGASQGALKKYREAQVSFSHAVELAPQSAEAHYNLGLVQRRHGKLDSAAASLREAVRLQPTFVAAHLDLANVLHRQGEYSEAARMLEAVQPCGLSPSERKKLAHVLRQIGDGLTKEQQHVQAEALFRRSLGAAPDDAETLARLASSLASQDRHADAVKEFEKALELRPEFPEALVNQGASLKSLGRVDEAEASYRQAIALRPNFAEAYCNLAALLVSSDRHAEAVDCSRKAVELKPDFAEAYRNLASALSGIGRSEEARETYRKCLQLRPEEVETHCNLGLMEMEQGNVEAALECYDEAVRIDPDAGTPHAARAMAWLTIGDFERGWREYEWRFHCKEFGPGEPRLPRWHGESLVGRSILLWTEQGLGDTIQFIRYAKMIKDMGARVILECPSALERILNSCDGIDVLVPRGQTRPVFEVYAPLMSLPFMLGTTLDTVPVPIPYLQPDAGLVDKWRAELQPNGDRRLRVGICWRGHPKNKADARRSFPLAQFKPIAQLPNVELISLQKQVGLDELNDVRDRFPVRELPNLDEGAGPFMDTAAVLKHLDLVISCDSSVAHLAGALGMPVWLALPYSAEWRWMRQRDDSPWYPRHRLFRQSAPGDWQGVFAEMVRELSSMGGTENA